MTATATAPIRVEDCQAIAEGEVTVAGLDAPLTIVRDRWGVPHIRANSTRDAFFGQGYAIGTDRLWQLELYRSMALGTAAALLNRNLLKLDIQNRRLGFAQHAAEEWERQSPEARAILQAYADGVNAAIATQPVPFEFRVLGHQMRPWEPPDSLAVIKMVNSGNHWAAKLKFGQVGATLGAEAVAALVASVPVDSAVITPSGASWTGATHPFRDDILSAMGQPGGPENSGGGSNCWVIHGSRTKSGWPIVAGDPHLALTVPGQWYLVHMECPEFTAAGPCNPCYPGPVFYGHNTRVAWTMTHAQGDRWDLYREEIRQGASGPEARFEEAWEPLTFVNESFAVRDGEPVSNRTWFTRHGPVISGDPERETEVIAARWGLAEPAHDIDALASMLRSTNVDEARRALRGYASVSGNFCFADVAGNIGYQYTGRIPKRAPWVVPVPGWDGRHEWDGDVPVEDLPTDANPPIGFIVTANNRTTGPGYPHYLSFLGTPFRATRLRELLEDQEVFAPDDMPRLQGDQVSIHARGMLPALLRTAATTAAARRLQALMTGWDGHMAPDSAAAVAFDATCEELANRTVVAYFSQVPNIPEMTVFESRRILHDEILDDAPLTLGSFSSWDAAVDVALEAAAETLEGRLGADTAAWRWDANHVATWRHNLGRDPEFAPMLNVGDFPIGGHADTPFSTMVEHGAVSTHGVSYRQVIDLSDVNAMQVCLPPGNSGRPGSPHYADAMDRWLNVEYHPFHIDWADIERNAEATLELLPV